MHMDLDHNDIDISLQLVWLLKYFLVISWITCFTLMESNIWDIWEIYY